MVSKQKDKSSKHKISLFTFQVSLACPDDLLDRFTFLDA